MNPRAKFKNIREGGYHSRKEAKRAEELKFLEKLGEISELKEQVKFNLLPKQGVLREVNYFADFTYIGEDGKLVVEDVKGMRLAEYILKKKMMKFFHNIDILET